MLMQLASLVPGTTAAAAAGQRRPAPVSAWHVEYLGSQDEGRASLQAFIADAFFETYGAEINHFCNTLIGCRDADGRWIAALGFSLAGDGPTFLEQYLDAPLEREIAAHSRQEVGRHQVVEVGNLASSHAGAARALIVSMTRFLHSQGLHWVAFTATASLRNSFTRLRLKTGVLAQADPGRLPDAGKRWGTYYSTKPQVMFGDIRCGYAKIF